MTTIKARHPVRNDFSSCSSGPVYYDSKGSAIDAFDTALAGHNLHLDLADCMQWYGDEGRAEVTVLDDNDDFAGYAIFSWYAMNSGRWEIVGYLA